MYMAAAEKAKDPLRRDIFLQMAREAPYAQTMLMPFQLWSAFATDVADAERRFNGKEIPVKGGIAGVLPGSAGSAVPPRVIFLAGLENGSGIVCEFAPKDRAVVAGLHQGRQALIVGWCQGLRQGSVILTNCRIISG